MAIYTSSAPDMPDRHSLDLMSHDKMPHNNKCRLASCLRLLKYLALFCVLKSVAAAPFPSSPVAGVADGNGVLFRDATFLQRADALTRQFLAMESLWPPVTELTGATPMVFFHQRKAGGSSIRAVLHRVCTDAKLQCYIICYNGIACNTYSLPASGSPSAVYAGHIPWGEPQNKFERYWHRSSSNFSCVTNYREPVSRIISCLAYRHPTEMLGKCVADMDVGLLRVLLNRPDRFGNSCLNEPFRIMSGIRSDHFIDRLDECDGFSHDANLELALRLTLKHASKCSPLVLESPDTYREASRRFNATPLRFVDGEGNMYHTNTAKNPTNCSGRIWGNENLKLVMCKTALERIIYHTVKRKAECALHGLDGQLCLDRSSNSPLLALAPRLQSSAAAPMPVPAVPATTHQQLNFLIAGVQKGGTTALGDHLRKCSPFVCLTPGEDHRYDSIKRLDDVFQLGNVVGCNVTSPLSRFGAEDPLFSYVSEGSLLDRVSSFAPALKIILLLREPVKRAFSQFMMEVARSSTFVRCCDFFAAMREEVSRGPPPKPSSKDIVWRGFYDAQVERLFSHYGQRNVQVTISERVFLSKSQRDAAYNRILAFIGVPVVSNFDAAVFTRPGSYIAQNKTLTLTHDAALFLRRLYVNDTNHLFVRLGYKVAEWDVWYCSSGLNVC